MVKKVLNAVTKPNNDGGLSSLFIRRRFNAGGVIGITGIVGGVSLANEALKERNTAKLGRIYYDNGPARMTKSFTSGSVQAMKRIANGNHAVFSDMAKEVVSSAPIDDYGASPALISAIYHMGGR